MSIILSTRQVHPQISIISKIIIMIIRNPLVAKYTNFTVKNLHIVPLLATTRHRQDYLSIIYNKCIAMSTPLLFA